MCPTFPSKLPLPILSLHLTTSSLLDTTLVEQPLHHPHGAYTPRFILQTVQDETLLYRLSRSTTSDATEEKPALVGCIKWHSKHAHSTLISVNNHTALVSDFLKKSVLGGTRKFHVPGQSSPLKWKHVGSRYECTLCSHACTAHRAVATYDPPSSTTPGRLDLYASSVASDSFRKGLDEDGYDVVDPSLLIHLILTSILITHHHRTHTRSVSDQHQHHQRHLHHNHHHHQKSQTVSHSHSSSTPKRSLSKCASTVKCGPVEVNTVKERIDLIGDDEGEDAEESRVPSSPFSPITITTTTTSSSHLPPHPYTPSSTSSPMLHPSSPTMLCPPSPNMMMMHPSSSSSYSPIMHPSPRFNLNNPSPRLAPSPSSYSCSLPASPITPVSSCSSSSHHQPSYGEPISAINSETFAAITSNTPPLPPASRHHRQLQQQQHHNLSQHREYAPTPTRPPTSASSVFATMSVGSMYAFAHAMGRSRSQGSTTVPASATTNNVQSAGGHRVHRTTSSSSTGSRSAATATATLNGPRANPTSPSSRSSSSGPRSATSCFFHFNHHKQSSNGNIHSNDNSTSTSSTFTNNTNGEMAMAPGPHAITPYYLPPPPPVPPPPAPVPTLVTSPTTTTMYGAVTDSPLRTANNALLLETRSPLPPSPMVRYTTEMYHLQFSDPLSPMNSSYPPPPPLPSQQQQQQQRQYSQSDVYAAVAPHHPTVSASASTSPSPLMLVLPGSPVPQPQHQQTLLSPSPLIMPSSLHSTPLPLPPVVHHHTMSPTSSATPTTTPTTTMRSPTSPSTALTSPSSASTRPLRIFQEVPPPSAWNEEEYELPPAYSEIEWTVRVREPRRGRRQQRQYDEEENREGEEGGEEEAVDLSDLGLALGDRMRDLGLAQSQMTMMTGGGGGVRGGTLQLVTV